MRGEGREVLLSVSRLSRLHVCLLFLALCFQAELRKRSMSTAVHRCVQMNAISCMCRIGWDCWCQYGSAGYTPGHDRESRL